MALSGSGLSSELKPAILTQLQAKFPIDGDLAPAEQTKLAEAQDKMAEAFAEGDGPTTVTHVQTNAEVDPNTMAVVPGAMSNGAGSLTGDGTVSVGTGKVL